MELRPVVERSGRHGYLAATRRSSVEVLEIDDGFDVHEYRTSLKLVTQDGASTTLSNREGLGCPACGEAFDRLFVTEDATASFGTAPNGPICLARTPERLLVLTH